MKGYCECGKVIDEVEFTQFGMCKDCRTKTITIPILEGDELWDLVHAFMLELHERKLIYVSNGTSGDIKASMIVDLLIN